MTIHPGCVDRAALGWIVQYDGERVRLLGHDALGRWVAERYEVAGRPRVRIPAGHDAVAKVEASLARRGRV